MVGRVFLLSRLYYMGCHVPAIFKCAYLNVLRLVTFGSVVEASLV